MAKVSKTLFSHWPVATLWGHVTSSFWTERSRILFRRLVGFKSFCLSAAGVVQISEKNIVSSFGNDSFWGFFPTRSSSEKKAKNTSGATGVSLSDGRCSSLGETAPLE